MFFQGLLDWHLGGKDKRVWTDIWEVSDHVFFFPFVDLEWGKPRLVIRYPFCTAAIEGRWSTRVGRMVLDTSMAIRVDSLEWWRREFCTYSCRIYYKEEASRLSDIRHSHMMNS